MDSNHTPPLPPPPAGGFGSQDGFGPAAAEAPRVPPFAVASLIFGLLAILGCWCWFSSLPLSFVGLVFGILALRQPRAYPGSQKKRWVAWTGIGCNAVAIVLSAVALTIPVIHLVF